MTATSPRRCAASSSSRCGISAGIAGADQHVVDPGQHRAVDGGGRGHLDLLQVVDADQSVVPLLGQVHLGEVGHHGQLVQRAALPQAQPGHGPVRRALGDAARHEVAPQHPRGHLGHREGGQRPAQVSAGIAPLQPPGQGEVQGRPRHHAQLPGAGHRPRQPPS
ncbi:hypothetical protein ACFSTC_63200 [Nonomuraea ferruginea]